MKTTSYTHDPIRRFLKLFVLFVVIVSLPVSSYAGVKRVAILPLKINAEKDLSFLGDGILSMLSSRISWDGNVTVSDPEKTAAALKTVGSPLNESTAREIGSRLAADYVLFGSLTLLGKSMSIDVKVADLAGDGPVRNFFRQSTDMDDIIPQINHLTEEINGKVFGRITGVRPASGKKAGEKPALHAHPERLLSGMAGDAQSPPISRVDESAVVPAAAPAAMAPLSPSPAAQFWKSHGFDIQIRGLALGDVDGDGKVETVVISSQDLAVYRLDDRGFYRLDGIEGKGHQQFIAVDVADINGNQRAEIFVTALNTNSKGLASFVLEWDGSRFAPIASNQKWYFRVQNDPKRGPLLYGQKKSYGNLFHSSVYELAWNGNGYGSHQKVPLPKGVNIFEFALGSPSSDDKGALLALDDDDRLRIYTPKGKQQWKSDDRYSGSELYLERMDEPERIVYLPHRLVTMDLNGDGSTEVILVNNHGTTGRLFKQYRRYNSGLIESLSWDGLGMASIWQTRKISGYISDFAIQDIDNDGRPELVAAVVSQRGSLIKKPRSSVIAFDLASLGPPR